MSEKKGSSPWVWFGCSCAALVVIGLIAVTVIGFMGVRRAQEWGESFEDPELRAQNVREVLNSEEFPDGLNPLFAMSVPFGVMELAILTSDDFGDGPPTGLGEAGMLYMSSRFINEGRLRDFSEGRAGTEVLRDSNINIDFEEFLGRGTFQTSGGEVLWSAHRGEFDIDQGSASGIQNFAVFDCDGDQRARFAIWFTPDTTPETPAEELDLAGTPADPARAREFFDHFSICEAPQ